MPKDLAPLAQHLQSHGRGEDSVLVHMTPREVGGLQALAQAHGGSLTINPETGLPEAGFLSSLLPTIIGGALTVLSGGALSPLMAAGMVGGGETLLSGGNLGKGLMAGLGAFGGAGLGSALSASGGVGNVLSGLGGKAATAAAPSAFTGAGATAAGMVPMGTAPASGLAQLGQNFANATNLGMAGLPGHLATAAAVSGLTQPLSQSIAYTAPKASNNWNYQGPYQMAPRMPQFKGPNADPNDSSEFNYFGVSNPPVLTANGMPPTSWPQKYAGGGPVALKDGAFVVDARTVSELGNGSSGAGQDLLAQHGGQPIHGQGDGVSDSIPAHVDGQQPARVARDEVKFDPHAVRRLGGGDARRGAQKLYALMEHAKQARMAADRGQDSGLRGLLGK